MSLDMNNSQTETGLKPLSATRFRIRSLLLVMVIVAVGAALCGTYFRGRSEAEQRYLHILWGSGFVSFAVWMLCYVWQRHRAEKKVGTIRFRLPWFVCLRTRLISPKAFGAFMLLTSAVIIIQSTGDCAKFAERGESFWHVTIRGLNPGLFLAVGLISIWWSAELWIGDQGVVWLSLFFPWGKIKKWLPHKKKSNTLVLSVGGPLLGRKVAVRVPEESQPQLAEFLQEKVGAPVAPGSAGG